MSERKWNGEQRLLAVQKLVFFIGLIVNVILIVSPETTFPIYNNKTGPPPAAIQRKNSTTTSASISPSPIPPSSSQPIESGKKWVTIIIVCGNGETYAVKEMKPLLTSAILLSSAPLHFVFVTDQGSSNRIRKIFQNELGYSKKPIKVDTWILSESSVNTFASLLDYNPLEHHSGIWGTSKLMLPWIVKDMDKAIMMDSDMLFLDDPARLWNEFANGHNSSTSSNNTTNTTEWMYKMPLHNPAAPFSICSCIMLVKLDQIRRSNTFPTLMEEALATQPDWKGEENHLYNAPNGDQGLYWAMLANENGSRIIAPLPEQWNADRCNNYFGVLLPTSEKAVSVLHNNCKEHRSYGSAHDYFIFYEKYRWHWLKGDSGSQHYYKVDVTVHPKETERLQNLFQCLKEKRDFTLCKLS
ncbi:unnamed protein product [Cylindrotheca closterium]|uniref:Uncharacterized protein n=1 Tax=Cylindrotheca closterium TaxID=2856 RepID=A0AAD2GBA6_9STRA|nr:unnamed protein product [Cylindrotheca closterium]